eukprot:gene46388-62833_t
MPRAGRFLPPWRPTSAGISMPWPPGSNLCGRLVLARPENLDGFPPGGRPPLGLRLRAWANRLRRGLWHALAYRMVFGERAAGGTWLPHTRIAPSSCIEPWSRLQLGDHVFIGQFNFLDASGGLTLEEGVQITNFVSIITHSTHRSVRLAGRLGAQMAGERPGDVRAPVHIGAYSFIGPHSLIEAG